MPGSKRRRAGVTLAELLVVMVLFGIVGTAIVRTLTRQQQYYRDQGNKLDGRRQLRLGASVIPVDLRSISSAGGVDTSDIRSMTEREIVIRAPVGSSIVCDKTVSTLTVPPTNLAKHTLTSWSSVPIVGDTLFVYNENILAGAEDDVWQKYAITNVSQSTAACPGAPYTDAALDPPTSKPRYVFTVNTALGGLIPDSVKLGAVIRFTRATRYRVEQLGTGGRWYLTFADYKAGAWSASEPIAGPYRPFLAGDVAPTGMQFRYFDTTGTRITSMASTGSVGRVDVYLRTERGAAALTGRNNALLTDSSLMRIAIRNSK